ncbi:MAG: hypothetical protein OEV44_07315, partial [Spirochaetota bacterium]|nr:hypothetical protein [Spirochaetota bacterium]
MKGFSTRFKLIFFITLFIFFFLTLTIVLGKIREGVTSLKYQVTYFFEKSLKTKVKIEKIEGDFVNELILKNMVIYHQFRDNVKFINVKTVRIKFDLVKAILKEKILIRNISTISIEDFTLYLDEYFTNLEAVKVIGGVDDGIDDGPKDIKVLLVKGNIQSNFVNLKNGKFRVSNLNGYFKKLITVNYFEGSGYFEGNKVYMNTKTPFKLAGNDSIKKGVMTGILDIKNLNFLGYTF